MAPADPEIARLVREDRLVEAAGLASAIGDAHLASTLYERACDWGAAAREALRAGEAARALELAVTSGDDALTERAVELVSVSEAAAGHAAARLAVRGHHAWAARVLEGAGHSVEAAREWERAGDATRAAAALDQAGQPAQATRVLEAALRLDPGLTRASAMLGALLVRYGKWDAALRALQRIPPGSAQRREALVSLVRALDGLQLSHAARAAEAELASLGGPPTPEKRGTAPNSAGAAPQARLFGRYDVVREVASSASARVLECVDVVHGDRVAIKLLLACDGGGAGRDALARFEREIRAMRALEHPRVVPLRDFSLEPPALVLAWMAGGTLEQMLALGRALAPARALEIADSLLSALGAAHRFGILHRDVKPANVLFDDAGAALLGDFGVAHLGDISATATAGVFGTLAYMSPEQRAGLPATARSDLFAVGVVLREMLTGRRPLDDASPPPLPSGVHRGLDARHDAAVARMTSSDPAVRPVDADEARALLSWSGGERLCWPATVERRGPPASGATVSSAPAPTVRVVVREDGSLLDAWAGRPIERLPLTEPALAKARAFAAADDGGLQTVLRVDRDDGTIWLEPLTGTVLDRDLSTAERALLRSTLQALHDAGSVHGRIDRAHVVLCDPRPVLRFAVDHPPTKTVEDDLLALANL